MACRRASHRNRRCARRSHPARRRPAANLRDRRSCPVSTVPRSAGRNNEGVPAGLAFRPALQSTWHSVTDCVSFGPDRIMPVHADVRWETLDPPCSGPCRMSAPRRTESPAPSRAFRLGWIPERKGPGKEWGRRPCDRRPPCSPATRAAGPCSNSGNARWTWRRGGCNGVIRTNRANFSPPLARR